MVQIPTCLGVIVEFLGGNRAGGGIQTGDDVQELFLAREASESDVVQVFVHEAFEIRRDGAYRRKFAIGADRATLESYCCHNFSPDFG